MNNNCLLALGLICLTISCSDPNKEYTQKVKQQVKEDALGVELNYESISFEWKDTLFVHERIAELKSVSYNVKDIGVGELFSKAFLTRERLETLRNWEDQKRGIPFNDDYNTYTEFAKANASDSEWLGELTEKITETDELLTNWESLGDDNIMLWKNALWHYARIDRFYSTQNPNPELWERLSRAIEEVSDKLPNQVLYYKALNTFRINNPALNHAEQELKMHFLFDTELKIIGKEELKD